MNMAKYNAKSIAETCCNGGTNDECPSCGIPNYGMDHNIADASWQGEDPTVFKTNIPALRAASMSNGKPHPWVVNNGINGRGAGFDWDPRKDKGFKTLYGDREEDAFSREMQESVDVCDVLSYLSR